MYLHDYTALHPIACHSDILDFANLDLDCLIHSNSYYQQMIVVDYHGSNRMDTYWQLYSCLTERTDKAPDMVTRWSIGNANTIHVAFVYNSYRWGKKSIRTCNLVSSNSSTYFTCTRVKCGRYLQLLRLVFHTPCIDYHCTPSRGMDTAVKDHSCWGRLHDATLLDRNAPILQAPLHMKWWATYWVTGIICYHLQ